MTRSFYRCASTRAVAVAIGVIVTCAIASNSLASAAAVPSLAAFRVDGSQVKIVGKQFARNSSVAVTYAFGPTTSDARYRVNYFGRFSGKTAIPPGFTGTLTVKAFTRRTLVASTSVVISAESPTTTTTTTKASTTTTLAPVGDALSIFVSPNGNDSNSGKQAAPFKTLARAQTAVRAMSASMQSDITVYLSDGNYPISQPLTLTSADSGRNGHSVVWTAMPGARPVINGGTPISGWQQIPGSSLWSAKVPQGFTTRQLYVNGSRAARARSQANPAGFTKTATGYTSSQMDMNTWKNIGDIEVFGKIEWRDFYCPVESVSGSIVTMQQPCWNVSQKSDWKLGLPYYIENARELLDAPGEWYIDRTAGIAYYMPRNGENMATAEVIAGGIDRLVTGDGVSAVKFSGLTFSYAGWREPSNDNGYVTVQTGIHGASDSKVPGNINFRASKNVVISGNSFTHLGAAGVLFDGGSQNSMISGNSFTDISAAAISLGNIDDPGNTSTATQNRMITVENNFISKIGADYWDNAAIFVGYFDSVKILHNEIVDVPYSPITLGWGWGALSYAKNNEVAYNYVHNFTQGLQDSAGIYLLGPQPGTRIHHNRIDSQINKDRGCLYPDQGTANTEWDHNVCSKVPMWLHLWTSSIHDNAIHDNWSDTSVMFNAGSNNTLYNNQVISNGIWSDEAKAVIAEAGLQPAYAGLSKR